MIILISGRSGSGKTTVVKRLIKMLGKENVCYLNQDSYYKDQSHLPIDKRQKVNYDHPDTIEMELFANHLNLLSNGKSIKQSAYDFITHTRSKKLKTIKSRAIIIVDGIHLLNITFIRNIADIKVFVDTEMDICFIRRLIRDVKERGRSVESVINQYLDTVKPMHEKYVAPSIKYADFIIKDGGHNYAAITQLKDIILKKLKDKLSEK